MANLLLDLILYLALTSEQMSTGSPHIQNDNIQESDNNGQDAPSNTHHIQNLVVYYINSCNTHNFRMQDSGNHSNCFSLPSSLTARLYLTKRGHLSDEFLHLEQLPDQPSSPNTTLTSVPSLPVYCILLSSLTTTFCCLIFFVIALYIGL